MIEFSNNDERYRGWLQANRNGYVVNQGKIHKVQCKSIQGYVDQAPTQSSSKTCSTDLAELQEDKSNRLAGCCFTMSGKERERAVSTQVKVAIWGCFGTVCAALILALGGIIAENLSLIDWSSWFASGKQDQHKQGVIRPVEWDQLAWDQVTFDPEIGPQPDLDDPSLSPLHDDIRGDPGGVLDEVNKKRATTINGKKQYTQSTAFFTYASSRFVLSQRDVSISVPDSYVCTYILVKGSKDWQEIRPGAPRLDGEQLVLADQVNLSSVTGKTVRLAVFVMPLTDLAYESIENDNRKGTRPFTVK